MTAMAIRESTMSRNLDAVDGGGRGRTGGLSINRSGTRQRRLEGGIVYDSANLATEEALRTPSHLAGISNQDSGCWRLSTEQVVLIPPRTL